MSSWNTSNVGTMSSMFQGASSLETLDVSLWDTSNVQYMDGMFRGASSLASLTLGEDSGFDDDTQLPGVSENDIYTGKWVRISDGVSDEAWWRGSSDQLMDRSSDKNEAPGRYVWQEHAPVAVVLGEGGTWDKDDVPSEVSALQSAGIGDLVWVPSVNPVREGHEFIGWSLVDSADSEPNVRAPSKFVVSEKGLALVAQWKKTPFEVTPEKPTVKAAEDCGVAGTVLIPEVEGVKYVKSEDGATVMVTAAPDEGYVFPEDATTKWELNVAAEACTGGLAQTGSTVTPFALGALLLSIAGLGFFAARRGRAAGKVV